jgi:hypothetical protein
MGISFGDDDEVTVFRRRILDRLATVGAPAGFASGEAFKVMTGL